MSEETLNTAKETPAEPAASETKPEKKRRRLTYERRKQLYGYGFISLWMIGTLLFFLIPLVKSFWYSFNEVTVGEAKMITSWAGLDKYDFVLNADPNYTTYLKDTLVETLWKTPLVLIFSLRLPRTVLTSASW